MRRGAGLSPSTERHQGSRTYTFTYKVTSQGQLQFSKFWQLLARRLGASGRPGVRLRECVVVNGVPATVVVA